MRKTPRKLTLNRDTVRNLAAPTLQDLAGGNASLARCSGACTPVSCGGTCNAICSLQSCNVACTALISVCLPCPI